MPNKTVFTYFAAKYQFPLPKIYYKMTYNTNLQKLIILGLFIEPSWRYLQNVFEKFTRKSFLRMYLLSNDHFDKLRGRIRKLNVEIAATTAANEALEKERQALLDILAVGETAFEAYREQYRINTTTNARHRLLTERLRQLLNDLSSQQIRHWHASVQVFFDIKSADYQYLFPKGKRIFQRANYDMRINEVHSLAERLAEYAVLSDLQTVVQTFGEQLYSIRSEQQAIEGMQQQNSNLLEEKRLELACQMHGMYGGLLMLYRKNPAIIESFYELQYLRRPKGKATAHKDNML